MSKKDWGVGELEFEALMRMLDNSVRTFEQQKKRIFKMLSSLKLTLNNCYFYRVSVLDMFTLNPWLKKNRHVR